METNSRSEVGLLAAFYQSVSVPGAARRAKDGIIPVVGILRESSARESGGASTSVPKTGAGIEPLALLVEMGLGA
jgi:hypothetical protein